jgi:hypothetical protein
MNGHGDHPPRIVRMRHDEVTCCYPLHDEPSTLQGAHDLPPRNGGQARRHTATVTLRTVGEVSAGIAMP